MSAVLRFFRGAAVSVSSHKREKTRERGSQSGRDLVRSHPKRREIANASAPSYTTHHAHLMNTPGSCSMEV